jgi:TRAP-type C4-dicarboxylate transport system substrate-binding protein
VQRHLIGIAAAALIVGGTSAPGHAETNWDLPLVWPQGNFHVQNAQRFADEVLAATDGEVVITVHSGGSLGFKGPEMLRVVRDGLVPIGDILLNQQVGDAPFFGIESVPYLAAGYDEVQQLQKFSRPVYEEIAQEFNQKLLYTVPWPPQAVFSKEPIVAPADLEGFTLRVVDKNGLDYFTALGAVPRQLPWGEVVPALASGAIEGVTTSSSSGVDGKFWEFLCCMNRFNWQSASNMVNVNLDAWNALAPEHQQAIEAVARRLEPEFWNVSKAEDESKLATLRENGIEITDPTPEMRAFLLEKAQPMWEEFIEAAGPRAREVIDAYLASTGKQ